MSGTAGGLWARRSVGLGAVMAVVVAAGLVAVGDPVGAAPTEQEAVLTPSDALAGDGFGQAVAISGDTAVVVGNDTGAVSGAAYVFVRSGTTWTQQQKLKAFDANPTDQFGSSAAIDGDTIVVGALGDDDLGTRSGSVYVFVRTGTTWALQQKLVASDGEAQDVFGRSVGVDGDTLVVGAQGDDDGGNGVGALYVFNRSGTTWTQGQKLKPSTPEGFDQLGFSVAIEGDTIVGGAPEGASGSGGSAYVFVRNAGVWTEQERLQHADSDPNNHLLGEAVAISGDTVVAGNSADYDVSDYSGAAYVFTRSGTTWTQQARLDDLLPGELEEEDFFGQSVAVDGDTALVSAFQDDDAGDRSGAVYVFGRSGTTWSRLDKLILGDGVSGEQFGRFVALSQGTALVGAFGDDGGAGPLSGTAYIFVGPGAADGDGDGIPDDLDTSPGDASLPAGFDDGMVPTPTAGVIVANDSDGLVTVEDLPDPDGVKIIVGGSSGDVTVNVCGFATLVIPAGTEINVTCASVIVEVVSGGPVVVKLPGDVDATVAVPHGVTVEISALGGDEFRVDHQGGSGDVTVTIDGVDIVVSEGDDPVDFSSNVAPSIDSLIAPTEPVNINAQPIGVTAVFSDPGVGDTHSCQIGWGDGGSGDGSDAVNSPCQGVHTYTDPGVYTVTVTITDDDGASDTATAMVVVYDPTGGFVTGGGWIESVPGACQLDAICAGAGGHANFGFVSKYKKGKTVPDGNTEFNFSAGGLNFHSDTYDWLVISQGGTNAQFKGSGTINGDTAPGGDLYKFMIWATDDDTDTFRIKIWSDGGVVYDSGDQAIGGGNIKVHKPKK